MTDDNIFKWSRHLRRSSWKRGSMLLSLSSRLLRLAWQILTRSPKSSSIGLVAFYRPRPSSSPISSPICKRWPSQSISYLIILILHLSQRIHDTYRRIEGSPNFRRVPLTLKSTRSTAVSPSDGTEFVIEQTGKMVCGRRVLWNFVFYTFVQYAHIYSGMPTVEG